MAVQKKSCGASLEENAVYIESLTDQHCIWFTVDDLEYLKRGGRVSPAVAFVGSLLGIKPVPQMDSEGHLIKVTTARGRKQLKHLRINTVSCPIPIRTRPSLSLIQIALEMHRSWKNF